MNTETSTTTQGDEQRRERFNDSCYCSPEQLRNVGCDCDGIPKRTIEAPPKAFIVSVYLVDQAYGGPEEGGWWYETGELVRMVRIFKNEKSAYRFCVRLNDRLRATLNKGRREISSVLSDGRYAADVHEDRAPEHYPAQRPHYE